VIRKKKKEREKRKTIKEQLLKDATFTIDKRKRGLHNPTGIIEKKRSERMISCTLNQKPLFKFHSLPKPKPRYNPKEKRKKNLVPISYPT
jgi:hypothetical protein